MNSGKLKIKKFFSNRNTVVIGAALLAVALLFAAYTIRVRQAITPIKVPVAKVTIQPRTKITDDMIEYKSVAQSAVDPKNTIIDAEDLKGHYSRVNTVIPQGSMFYTAQVVGEKERADSYVDQLEEGEVLYNLSVTNADTFGNSILPGSFIDIYIETTSPENKALVGKFIQNVKILAVMDSNNQNVFENSELNLRPAVIIFSLPSEMRRLLRGAEIYGTIERGGAINIVPVPIKVDSEDAKDLKPTVANTTIEEIIQDKIEEIPADELDALIESEIIPKTEDTLEEGEEENQKGE